MSGKTVDVPVVVRWSDQDPNGHVNNAVIVTLIEEARVRWRLTSISDGGLHPDFVALVANITLDYRRPVLFGPELVVTIRVSAVGTRSYTLDYVAHQAQRLVFEATTVMVAMGSEGQPRELLDYERAFLRDGQMREN